MFLNKTFILIFIITFLVKVIFPTPINYQLDMNGFRDITRAKRQIDLTIKADHDDQDDETELALEAIASLWKSPSGKTQVDGSARVIHRSSSQQLSNTRYSAQVHLHHDYKK